jgi:arylsulfatase A-like enzyme
MKNQQRPTRYWTGLDQYAVDNLEGDDSRVIMDRVIPFIEQANGSGKPFLAVVWFHTPHNPVIAGDEYKKIYSDFDDDKQHYYGCITAMDEQIARLRERLSSLGISDNTIIFFCSDNGPAGEGGGTKQTPGGRQQGSAGEFRGRKGALYEGGVRVPGIVYWPGAKMTGKRIAYPVVTCDYFVTLLGTLGLSLPSRPYDGIDIRPALEGKTKVRKGFIGFQSPTDVSLVTDRYKLLAPDLNTKTEIPRYELYDLHSDPYERRDIADKNPRIVAKMKRELAQWMASCKHSDWGGDYAGYLMD